MTTEVIAKAGTPILSHDGEFIIAKFRRDIVLSDWSACLHWQKLCPVPASYAAYAAGQAESDPIKFFKLSARRIFKRGPFDIWMMDVPVAMKEWDLCFGSDMFDFPESHPNPSAEYRVAEAAETILRHPIGRLIPWHEREYISEWARMTKLATRCNEPQPQPQPMEGIQP